MMGKYYCSEATSAQISFDLHVMVMTHRPTVQLH